jgi:hypothetical protein
VAFNPEVPDNLFLAIVLDSLNISCAALSKSTHVVAETFQNS